MAFVSFSGTKQYAALSTQSYPLVTVTEITVSDATGDVTLTVAQMLGGFLIVDCQDQHNLILPDASDLVAQINGCSAGTAFDLIVNNVGDADTDLIPGAGGTIANPTVGALRQRQYLCLINNITPLQESYTLYWTSAIDFS